MHAVQILSPGNVEIVHIPVPEPGPGQVLVQVEAVTTCPQWDLHLYEGVPMFAGRPVQYPYTIGQPGHEMAGVVVQLGKGVAEFAEGDRVVAWRDQGHNRQGCYAEYNLLDAENLLPLPPDADFARFASLELAMCVGASFLDLKKCTDLTGKRFGIIGLGGSGLIAAQYARAEGAAQVIGFELNEKRAQQALELGVDRVLDPGLHSPAELGGEYVHISLDCVGAKAAAEFLLGITAEITALFGVQREPYLYPAGFRKLKLFGYPGHSRAAADYALSHLLDGTVDLTRTTGIHLPLTEYERGVRMLQTQDIIKVCFHPEGG